MEELKSLIRELEGADAIHSRLDGAFQRVSKSAEGRELSEEQKQGIKDLGDSVDKASEASGEVSMKIAEFYKGLREKLEKDEGIPEKYTGYVAQGLMRDVEWHVMGNKPKSFKTDYVVHEYATGD